MEPLLAADQAFHGNRGPAGHAFRGATVFLQRLHASPGVAGHPLVTCFTADAEFPAQFRHREMIAPC